MLQIEKFTAMLFAVIALTFSYSAFAEDDEKPCTEENPCEEVVTQGSREEQHRLFCLENPYDITCSQDHGPTWEQIQPTEPQPNAFESEAPTINYEDSYRQMCHDSFLTGYDEQNWFQQMFSASAYQECINAQTVTNAMCSLLDMQEVLDDAGTVGGCAAACAKAAANYKKIRNKSLGPGGIAVCITLCTVSINAGDDAICQ